MDAQARNPSTRESGRDTVLISARVVPDSPSGKIQTRMSPTCGHHADRRPVRTAHSGRGALDNERSVDGEGGGDALMRGGEVKLLGANLLPTHLQPCEDDSIRENRAQGLHLGDANGQRFEGIFPRSTDLGFVIITPCGLPHDHLDTEVGAFLLLRAPSYRLTSSDSMYGSRLGV